MATAAVLAARPFGLPFGVRMAQNVVLSPGTVLSPQAVLSPRVTSPCGHYTSPHPTHPPRAGGGGGSTPLPPATLASPAARPLRIPYVDITVLISSPHIKSRKVRFISRNVYRYRFHGARVASAQVQVVFRGSKTVISH